MTLADWINDTKRRYRTERPLTATKGSVCAFARGIERRSLDPMVGRSIWQRGDWDVLLVMDAARVDLTREAVTEYDELPNDVDAVWSNASCSIDWINRTFNGYPDEARRTGYVTANPFANNDEPTAESANLDETNVGHLDLVYQSHWQDIGNGIETVPPASVTDRAIEVWRRRDELDIDRLVVHYMQPHEPFRARPEWGGGDHKLLKNLVDDEAKAGSSIYPKLRSGSVSLDEFREVYLDNHHWVLDDITERLLGNIEGNVVITADHSNGLGEWGAWHHPPGRIAPAIRKVPWLEVKSTDEETVVPDTESEEEEEIESTTEEKLEALGYL